MTVCHEGCYTSNSQTSRVNCPEFIRLFLFSKIKALAIAHKGFFVFYGAGIVRGRPVSRCTINQLSVNFLLISQLKGFNRKLAIYSFSCLVKLRGLFNVIYPLIDFDGLSIFELLDTISASCYNRINLNLTF